MSEHDSTAVGVRHLDFAFVKAFYLIAVFLSYTSQVCLVFVSYLG
jgi:hypothetical protein